MSETNKKSNRIAKNTFVLYFRMAITMLIGLYTGRVILDVLGEVDYGVYNVVGGVTTMFVFLNSSMSVSTARFIAYAIGKKDKDLCAKTYNQARIIHYALALIIVILIETVGLWFVYNKLTIPPSRLHAAVFILHAVSVVTVLNIIASPDNALIISYEKMTAYAYLSILDSGLKLLSVFALQVVGGDKLVFYAIFMCGIQVIDRLSFLIYCRSKFDEPHHKFRFDKPVFKKMISFACWNLGGNLANMTLAQGITIVINLFCGPAVNAARGVAAQLFNHIQGFSENIRTAINPQLYKSYAEGDFNYMHKLIAFSSLSCCYLLIILGFPVFWLAKYILDIWLVKVPDYTVIFFQLTLVYTIVNSFANPIIIAIHATGDIKKFQIVEAVLMLMTLPCAYVFLRMGLPPYFAYIAMIIFAFISQLGRLWTVLPAIKLSWKNYYIMNIHPVVKVIAIAVIPTLFFILLRNFMNDIIYSVSQSIISFISVCLSVYYLGLNITQREKVKIKTKGMLRKIHH